jgi:hypothetical protein
MFEPGKYGMLFAGTKVKDIRPKSLENEKQFSEMKMAVFLGCCAV